MSKAGHGNKGDANRVRNQKAWYSSPLWDKVGPDKKKETPPPAKTKEDK